jgi:hypothetical protein
VAKVQFRPCVSLQRTVVTCLLPGQIRKVCRFRYLNYPSPLLPLAGIVDTTNSRTARVERVSSSTALLDRASDICYASEVAMRPLSGNRQAKLPMTVDIAMSHFVRIPRFTGNGGSASSVLMLHARTRTLPVADVESSMLSICTLGTRRSSDPIPSRACHRTSPLFSLCFLPWARHWIQQQSHREGGREEASRWSSGRTRRLVCQRLENGKGSVIDLRSCISCFNSGKCKQNKM